MSKYSEEYKLKVVKAYLSGEGGAGTIAKKYKVARTCVQQWVAQYELTESFTKPTRHFSGEFRLKVLNYQQEHHLSDSQTALIFGITNHGTICAWRKKYITGGTEALFQKQGRRSKMPKSVIPDKPREEWTKDEELAALRAENLYLKKLWALIQEEEKQQKETEEKENSESLKN